MKITITKTGKPKTPDDKSLESEFVMGPFPKNHGHNIMNALRRTLLNGIPGCDIVQAQISEAATNKAGNRVWKPIPSEQFGSGATPSEYMDIAFALKKAVFKVEGATPGATFDMFIERAQPGDPVVRLGEAIPATPPPFQWETVNPELVLCTLDKGQVIRIDWRVKYSYDEVITTMAKTEEAVPGQYSYEDAHFNPIENLAFSIDNVHEGDLIRDQITLTVRTDGSITPNGAMKIACAQLVHYFQLMHDEIS